jgi:hypothetical protein
MSIYRPKCKGAKIALTRLFTWASDTSYCSHRTIASVFDALDEAMCHWPWCLTTLTCASDSLVSDAHQTQCYSASDALQRAPRERSRSHRTCPMTHIGRNPMSDVCADCHALRVNSDIRQPQSHRTLTHIVRCQQRNNVQGINSRDQEHPKLHRTLSNVNSASVRC